MQIDALLTYVLCHLLKIFMCIFFATFISREHLGILNDPDFVDLTDVHLDSFYKEVWIKQAAINTTCYDKVNALDNILLSCKVF